MQTITIKEIDGKLKTLSKDKLVVVYHFVSFLAEHDLDMSDISARELMLASEGILAGWNTPEEDRAWADL